MSLSSSDFCFLARVRNFSPASLPIRVDLDRVSTVEVELGAWIAAEGSVEVGESVLSPMGAVVVELVKPNALAWRC